MNTARFAIFFLLAGLLSTVVSADDNACSYDCCSCDGDWNAICHDLPDEDPIGYNCTCSSGYEWNAVMERCTNIDDCATSNHNCAGAGNVGAMCQDLVNGWQCSCVSNGPLDTWVDLHQTGVCNRINWCDPRWNTCGGHSVACVEDAEIGGTFPVNCTCESGFEGLLCEKNIDDCAPAVNTTLYEVCLEHGKCVDMINGWKCGGCDADWTGPWCNITRESLGLRTPGAMSAPRFYLGAYGLANKAYWGGGVWIDPAYTQYVFSSVVDIYEATTNTWTATNMSVARVLLEMKNAGPYLLFAGGTFLNGQNSRVVDILDTTTDEWLEPQELSSGRYYIGGTNVGRYALFCGGLSDNPLSTLSPDCDIFDSETMSFRVVQRQPRYAATAASAMGVAVVFGGVNQMMRILPVDIWNSNDDTWETGYYASEDRYFAAAASEGSKVFFAGGASLLSKMSDRVDIYDVVTKVWSWTSMQKPKYFAFGAGIDGVLYIVGGYNPYASPVNYDDLDNVEIFNITSGQWSFNRVAIGHFAGAGAIAGGMVMAGGGQYVYTSEEGEMAVGITTQIDIAADLGRDYAVTEWCGITCNNHGHCGSATSTTCTCDAGFLGDFCETNIDDCVDNAVTVCSSGGDIGAYCVDGANEFSCHCSFGWAADSSFVCRNIDDCVDNQCGQYGSCVDGLGSHVCDCQSGYYSHNGVCENIDDCASSPCAANGDTGAQCFDGVNAYTCACSSGFQLSQGQCLNIDDCASPNPCRAGGDDQATCQDGINSHACLCSSGYSSDDGFCANINDCADHQCASGEDTNAGCHDLINDYSCTCSAGFRQEGHVCVNIDDCDADAVESCRSNGDDDAVCVDLVMDYSCGCSSGFHIAGHVCDDIDDCIGITCGAYGDSQATCVDEINGFHCACSAGFEEHFDGEGQTLGFCFDIDNCVNVNCAAGGDTSAYCINYPGDSFLCQCTSGWTDFGEGVCRLIDYCYDANACGGHADCTANPANSPWPVDCDCHEGFTGPYCGTNIEDCPLDVNGSRIDVCNGHGLCADGINSWSCACDMGWTGEFCDVTRASVGLRAVGVPPNPNRVYLSATSIGEKLIVGGGYTFPSMQKVDSVDIYNTLTGEWSVTNVTGISCAHGAAVTVGIFAMFSGGLDAAGTVRKVVHVYNYVADEWSTAEMSTPRLYHTANAVGPYAIFYGGMNLASVIVSAEIFDTRDLSWSVVSITARYAHASASTMGVAVFLGGLNANGFTSVVDIWDSNTNVWTKDRASERRYFLGATALGSKVYFAGGMSGVINTPTDRVDIYDVVTKVWTIAALSQARYYVKGIADGNVVAFVGGVQPAVLYGGLYDGDQNERNIDVVDFLNVDTGVWSQSRLEHGHYFGSITAAAGVGLATHGVWVDGLTRSAYTSEATALIFDFGASFPIVEPLCGITCNNRGSCPSATATSCVCDGGYSGNNCETNIDDCAGNPCAAADDAEAECVDGLMSHSCSCSNGFETAAGVCQNIDDCASTPCAAAGDSGAVCHDGVASHSCDCSTGFSAVAGVCENVDDCSGNPCDEFDASATCVDGVNTWTCSCSLGFEDADGVCQNIDDCASTPCGPGGICHDGLNTHTCDCLAGFVSNSNGGCDNIDDCVGNTCALFDTSAGCTDGVQSYKCECSTGFAQVASVCQNIDDCADNPCAAAGDTASTCADGLNSHSCTCSAGYTSTGNGVCSDATDNCAGNPCVNGQCHDGLNTYTCDCSFGYEFNTASHSCTNIDDCANNPCAALGDTAAVCVDGLNTHTCQCSAEWADGGSGVCSNVHDDCASHPCNAGGDTAATCLNLIVSHVCGCSAGFLEKNGVCTNIDDCSPNPCTSAGDSSAHCTDGMNTHSCLCSTGFNEIDGVCTGVICAGSSAAPTNGKPGTCAIANSYAGTCAVECNSGFEVVGSATRTCAADGHWTAIQATCHNIDDCAGNTCGQLDAQATCADGVNGYTCQCSTGYTSVNNVCRPDDGDDCAYQPCSSLDAGAVCLDGVNSYSCQCSDGFVFDGNFCSPTTPCGAQPCGLGGDAHAACTNTVDSYTCACSTGYAFTSGTCSNFNACANQPCRTAGDVAAVCTDLAPPSLSYTCSCSTGYASSAASSPVCRDIDGCAVNSCANLGDSFAVCVDRAAPSIGSTCTCTTGYVVQASASDANAAVCAPAAKPPTAVIDGPSTVGSCSTFTLSGSRSEGGANPTYAWTYGGSVPLGAAVPTPLLSSPTTSSVAFGANDLQPSFCYTVVLVVTSTSTGLSSTPATAQVCKASEPMPTLVLTPPAPPVYRSKMISISSKLSSSPCSTVTKPWVYSWSQTSPVPAEPLTYSHSALSLPAGFLAVGTYTFLLTATAGDTAVSASATVTVERTPLVASIASGNQLIDSTKSYTVDASASYDPDHKSDYTTLKFTWFQNGVVVAGDGQTLTIAANLLVADSRTTVTVSVSPANPTDTRQAQTFSVSLTTLPVDGTQQIGFSLIAVTVAVVGGIPTGTGGTALLVDSMSTVRVSSTLVNTTTYTYKWTNLEAGNDDEPDVIVPLLDLTAQTSPNLALAPHTLQAGCWYLLQLDVTVTGGLSRGSAWVTLEAAALPESGANVPFVVLPSTGVAFTDKFTMTAQNWFDPQQTGPLTYKFAYYTTDVNSMTVLTSGLTDPTASAYLPAPPLGQSQVLVTVVMYAYTAAGASASLSTQVIVYAPAQVSTIDPTLPSDGKLECFVYNVTQSALVESTSVQDASQSLQLISMLTGYLNTAPAPTAGTPAACDSTSGSGGGSTNSSQTVNEQRVQFRQQFVDVLVDITHNTAIDVGVAEQLLSTLASLSSDSSTTDTPAFFDSATSVLEAALLGLSSASGGSGVVDESTSDSTVANAVDSLSNLLAAANCTRLGPVSDLVAAFQTAAMSGRLPGESVGFNSDRIHTTRSRGFPGTSFDGASSDGTVVFSFPSEIFGGYSAYFDVSVSTYAAGLIEQCLGSSGGVYTDLVVEDILSDSLSSTDGANLIVLGNEDVDTETPLSNMITLFVADDTAIPSTDDGNSELVVSDLTDPIVFTTIIPYLFTPADCGSSDEGSSVAQTVPVCTWWDEQTASWSEEGCTSTHVVDEETGTVVTCSCTHLTEFALFARQALAECPDNSPAMTNTFLAYAIIYAVVAAVGLVQFGRTFVARANGASTVLLAQHAGIALIALCRMFVLFTYSGAIPTFSPIVGLLLFAAIAAEFGTFTLMVAQWASIYHFSMKTPKNPFDRIKLPFFAINGLFAAVVLIGFALLLGGVDTSGVVTAMTAIQTIFTLLVSASFAVYSYALIQFMRKANKKGSKATSSKASLETKILTGGVGFAVVFCAESAINLASLFVFESDSQSQVALLAVFWAFNLVGLLLLLNLFARAVTDLAGRGPNGPNSLAAGASSRQLATGGSKRSLHTRAGSNSNVTSSQHVRGGSFNAGNSSDREREASVSHAADSQAVSIAFESNTHSGNSSDRQVELV